MNSDQMHDDSQIVLPDTKRYSGHQILRGVIWNAIDQYAAHEPMRPGKDRAQRVRNQRVTREANRITGLLLALSCFEEHDITISAHWDFSVREETLTKVAV